MAAAAAMDSRGQHPEMGVTRAADFDQDDVQDLILTCNKDGMENLRKAKSARHDPLLKAAFDQFKYAEAMLLAKRPETEDTTLLAVTCNNLGCYYKKVGKYHCALSYLRRALKMEVELQADEVTLASTHLNLCAILSKLEKHDKAVQHALSALDLMSKRVTQSDTAVSQDDYSVLAIAYHNVAMEREFLQQWDQAVTAFQTGYQVAKRLLGENHPLTITLSKNVDAVLLKAKAIKAKIKPGLKGYAAEPQPGEESPGGGGGALGNAFSLPPISSPRGQPELLKPLASARGPRTEAADWVKGEEALWTNFAQRAFREGGAGASLTGGMSFSGASFIGRGSMFQHLRSERDASGGADSEADDRPDSEGLAATMLRPEPQPLMCQTLRELQDSNHPVPKAHDMGLFRLAELPKKQLLKKAPMFLALDDHPDALMDIIEVEGESQPSKRAAPNDFRPHRTMKRSTRTSLVVRRTGVFNSTQHRERVMADLERKRMTRATPWKSAGAQRTAAERIQRVWRSWYQYCQENSEWMTITWICATMIQSHWRSYHVRRQRMDACASLIQRRIRGFLVRSVLRKHRAVVTIQRRITGVLTRKKMKHLHDSATAMQRLMRGGLARKRFREFHAFKVGMIICIQKHVRSWMAKRYVRSLAKDKRHDNMLWKATTDLQRLFRGWKGRQKANKRRLEYQEMLLQFRAACRIQNLMRQKMARRRVNQLRAQRLMEMERAATFLRKVWMGARTRKRYRLLQQEFMAAEGKIVTIQRYLRGCICRLKMWREAVRTEEELWAVIEMQRRWRGYQGRIRYEEAFEAMWRREMSAAMLQRNIRGWLARTRVNGARRKLARAAWETARARFRAAQRIQALARGVLNRRRTRMRRAQVVWAAVRIQRVARGKALRTRMWNQVVHQRATLITAVAKGFIIRRRRLRLLRKVVRVQRAWRRLRDRPVEERRDLRQGMLVRKQKVMLIQRHYRLYTERKTLKQLAVSAFANAAVAA